MRIVHIISGLDPQHGGPTAVLLGLGRGQAAAGLNVTVAATWRNQSGFQTAEALKAGGVKVQMIGPARNPMSRYRGLGRLMEELAGNADVVHIHGMWESIQHEMACACRRRGVPYVVTPHGMLSPWNMSRGWPVKPLYLALRGKRNLDGAAAIHFTSQVESDLAKRLKIKAPPLVETLGVDLSEFDPLPAKGVFRAAWPQIGKRPIVLFLSRINYKKGLDLLIPAFAKAKLDGAILVLAGPDTDGYGNVVREMVRSNGVEDHVLFTGMLHGRQRVEALVDADLFVLPSYQENFGIAVVEALACACPVMISDQVNICREIEQAQVGGVVPAQIDPLAEGLRRWMTDAALRATATANARPFVRNRYDWNKIAQRWTGHYQQIMQRSDGGNG